MVSDQTFDVYLSFPGCLPHPWITKASRLQRWQALQQTQSDVKHDCGEQEKPEDLAYGPEKQLSLNSLDQNGAQSLSLVRV